MITSLPISTLLSFAVPRTIRLPANRSEYRTFFFMIFLLSVFLMLKVHKKNYNWYPRNPKRNDNYALSTQEVRNIGYSCILIILWTKCARSTQYGVVRSTNNIILFCFEENRQPKKGRVNRQQPTLPKARFYPHLSGLLCTLT